MSLFGESLSSESTTGPGAEIMFDEPRAVMAQITFVGGSGTFNVALEGTIDGVNWAIFQQFNAGVAGSYLVPTNNQLVMGVRANLTNAGGGSVTAFLSATKF